MVSFFRSSRSGSSSQAPSSELISPSSNASHRQLPVPSLGASLIPENGIFSPGLFSFHEGRGRARISPPPSPLSSSPPPVERRASEPVGIGNTASERDRLPGYTLNASTPAQSQATVAPIPTYESALTQGVSSPFFAGDRISDEWEDTYMREYFGQDDFHGERGEGEQPDTHVIDSAGHDSESDEDAPLLPPQHVLSDRRFTFAGIDTHRASVSDGIVEPPVLETQRPPAGAPLPPAYSPEVRRDELMLVSTAHLSPDHPASAFFNAISLNPSLFGGEETAGPVPLRIPSQTPDATGEINQVTNERPGLMTGGKKLNLTITSTNARRLNANNTGPLFLKLGRAEVVKGCIVVKGIDHAIGLEIAILGYVKTVFYARGQYSMMDSYPLGRSAITLFPPSPESTEQQHLKQTKDGQLLIEPGTTFPFEIQMPTTHWRGDNIDLPPTCEILQLGLQAAVEYVLRVKVTRKGGWRMNEELTVPIIYQSRSYISPRRLRALMLDDQLNPGWRRIPLNGGLSSTDPTPVQATLLLPSPMILYIPTDSPPPAIPFHLHFYHPAGGSFLKGFTNPRESTIIVRLQRVATVRVDSGREVRKSEIPSQVLVWEDGGEKVDLGEVQKERRDKEKQKKATSGKRRKASSSDGPGKVAAPSSQADGKEQGGGKKFSFVDGKVGSVFRRKSSTPSAPLSTTTSRTVPISAASPRADHTLLSSSPIAEHSLSSCVTNTSSTGGHDSCINTSSATSPSTSSTQTQLSSLSATDIQLHGLLTLRSNYSSQSTSCENEHHLNPFGQDSRQPQGVSADLKSKLIQSFNTPEIAVTYIIQIGVQPKGSEGSGGKLKDGHVWGGGLVEVVWG
ncbi:hypothetical protein C366_01391 [Cryptococcus neoformans Tu401-1]|nr:hypothetical protein C366_01391 [Cryptococcus neoformans var. grubii Tu401-1]